MFCSSTVTLALRSTISVTFCRKQDHAFSWRSVQAGVGVRVYPVRWEAPRRLSRVPFLFLEPLDDVALLRIPGRPLGRLLARGGVPLLPFGDLVARLGVRLVSPAFLYVAKAVYAHAFSFSGATVRRTPVG